MIDKSRLKKIIQSQGTELDSLALNRFDKYAELLVEWNKIMNLTAITDAEEIEIKHFSDSIMPIKYFDFSQVKTVIDIGTGAGFPAIPLLICLPDLKFTLVDSLQKRLGFLQTVLKETELDATLVHGRAEDLGQKPEYRENFDLAIARAVAPLNVLCEYCLPFVKVGGHMIALKGSSDETAEAQMAIDTLGGKIESNVSYKLSNDDRRSIVVIKKISQTPTTYPRKTKKISTKPL